MFATMLIACALSVVELVGAWWGKTLEGKFGIIDTTFAVDISLWKVKSHSVVAIEGASSSPSSSSEGSLDELCKQVDDQSPDDAKKFCQNVVVIRVFSVLGLIAAVVGLLSASLLASSLFCGLPWKIPPSSSLLLGIAIMAGCLALFTLVSIIIAASMKDDGFNSWSVNGLIHVKSSDFGARGVGFICSVLLLVTSVVSLTCSLASRRDVQREATTRQMVAAPTILGNMSNAVKKAAGVQNV